MSLGRVLVVGGCGCLGYHIVKQLIDGHDASEVFVLARAPDHNLVDGAQYLKADITKRSEVEAVLRKVKPRVVIHTAAAIPIGPRSKDLAALLRVNVEGTRNVLEASQEAGVLAFVNSSSPSIVHTGLPSHQLVNADETLPILHLPEQKQVYSHTKGLAEELVVTANGTNGMHTVSLRPSGMFGERDLMMTKTAIERARAGKANIQIGDNSNKFDVTYVGNAAEAHILAAKALIRQPLATGDLRVDGEAFNITNGDPRPFWDVPRMFATAAGDPVPKNKIKVLPVWFAFLMAGFLEWAYWIFTFGRKQPSMTRLGMGYTVVQRTFSIEKARRRLGYSPRIPLEEGMKRGVGWFDGRYGKNVR
jgi:sterol-4alpha-carboxylate 3-dehydrogenase (decarboxylating)